MDGMTLISFIFLAFTYASIENEENKARLEIFRNKDTSAE
jgi:hypothetical protein